MKIDMYRFEEVIFENEGTRLYRAVCEDEPDQGLFYAVKEYTGQKVRKDALYKERAITHEVENYAPKCVVIPILRVLRKDNQTFGLMQMKENGAFLIDALRELEQRYGSGKIPLSGILAIIEEILLSLETLHFFPEKDENVGYLHLDLHPYNIFLESFDAELAVPGRAKFIDFLTARKLSWKALEDKAVLFKENVVHAYTQGFSAPELYRPDGNVGVWTDLFSVCALFYRFYTGKCLERYGFAEEELDGGDTITFRVEVAKQEILRQAKERGENPVIAHLLAAFVGCGIAENGRYRYKSAAECRKTVQEIAECLRACGYSEGEKHGRSHRPDYEKMTETAWHMLLPLEEMTVDRITFDAARFEEAVRAQHARMGTDNSDMSKENYLFRVYWKLFQENQDKISKEVYHLLLNDGLICSNHKGDLQFAMALYRKLEEARQGMPLMAYFQVTNNAAGTFARAYDHREAFRIVRRNVVGLAKLRKTQLEIGREIGMNEPASFYHPAYARGLSALGMHMASLEARGIRQAKDKPWEAELSDADVGTTVNFPSELRFCDVIPEDPMTAFYMAHRLFGEEAGNGGDWAITARHILHYAIQIRHIELFEKYAAGVFGKTGKDGKLLYPIGIHGESLIPVERSAPFASTGIFGGHASFADCLEDILANKEIRFTLHVFLKGIYHLFFFQVDEDFDEALLRLINDPRLRTTNSMPVELVYRYIGCILWKRMESLKETMTEAKEKLYRGAKLAFALALQGVPGAVINPDENLTLRMCISYQTKAIYQELSGAEEEEKNTLREHFLTHADRSGLRELARAVREGRKLSRLLVFEYC